MSVHGTKRRRTKAEIDELVSKWRESGQSVPTFSTEHNLNSSSMYQWVTERKDGATRKAPDRKTARKAPAFTKVDVVDDIEQRCGGSITIVTAAGHAVMVGREGVDPDVLRMVLSVVR